MVLVFQILIVLLLLVLAVLIAFRIRRTKHHSQLPENYKELLNDYVKFYRQLDEAGKDAKLIAVPHDKLSAMYHKIKEVSDLPELLIKQIEHFFENYKDLEPGKWVKVDGWADAAAARAEIVKAAAAYNKG